MSANLPKQWLDRATEDAIVAQLLLTEEHFAHTCFLAQQAIEKALKAFLLYATNTYPRTHRLVDLLGQCAAADPEFAQFLADCTIIDQYYIPTRYPDGIPGSLATDLPGKIEAQEAVDIVRRILAFVIPKLPT